MASLNAPLRQRTRPSTKWPKRPPRRSTACRPPPAAWANRSRTRPELSTTWNTRWSRRCVVRCANTPSPACWWRSRRARSLPGCPVLRPRSVAKAAGPPPPASSRAPAPFHPTRGGLEPPMPVPLLWRGFHGRLVQRWANAVRAGPPIRQAQLEHNAHLRFQAFVALHVDRGEMDKHVGLTSRGLDEAIALFIAEPFDLPCLHGVSS